MLLTACGGTSESTKSTFTVTFENYDSSVLYTTEVNPGQEAIYVGDIPTKPSLNPKISYVFSGWDKPLTNILSDCTRVAQYREDYSYTKGLSFSYVEEYDSYEVKSYIGSETDIIVPPYYSGKSVFSLGDRAFANTAITSISIPSSILIIKSNCFDNCLSLTSVEIPEGVTQIRDYVFVRCANLVNVSFPKTLQNASWSSMFIYATSLSSITIASGNAFYKAIDDIVYSANGSDLLFCPPANNQENVVVPSGVTSIASGSFHNCSNLKTIQFPTSLTSIGSNSFYDCASLSSISIPANVNSISSTAFAHCAKLSSITVDATNQNYKSSSNVLYSYSGLTLLTYPAGKTDTSYTILDGVETIASCAFDYAKSLTYIVIPNTVSSIESNAFSTDNAECKLFFKGSSLPNSLGDNWNYNNLKYYFYSETQPTESNKYWRYVSGVPTIWVL